MAIAKKNLRCLFSCIFMIAMMLQMKLWFCWIVHLNNSHIVIIIVYTFRCDAFQIGYECSHTKSDRGRKTKQSVADINVERNLSKARLLLHHIVCCCWFELLATQRSSWVQHRVQSTAKLYSKAVKWKWVCGKVKLSEVMFACNNIKSKKRSNKNKQRASAKIVRSHFRRAHMLGLLSFCKRKTNEWPLHWFSACMSACLSRSPHNFMFSLWNGQNSLETCAHKKTKCCVGQ